MSTRYWWAAGLAAAGLASLGVLLLVPDRYPALVLVTAVALPMAVMMAVHARLDLDPWVAMAWGAAIGTVVAVMGYGIVFTLAYFLLGGFAEPVSAMLEILRVDPDLIDVFGSEWLLVGALSAVVVAPLTEEIGKALGAIGAKPAGRTAAFAAGVAAGAGFAALENILYAYGWSIFTDPAGIVAGRALGAAVHPLASGLVVLGWWEWRNGDGTGRLVRGFLSGVGVHALWNGSLVVLTAVEIAYGFEQSPGTVAAVSWAYVAAVGALMMALLWRVTRSVAVGRDPLSGLEFTDSFSLTAWIVLTASFLVPVVILLIAFPGLY